MPRSVRIRPIFGGLHETGPYGVLTNVVRDAIRFIGAARPVVEPLILPESFTGSAENGVALRPGPMLESTHQPLHTHSPSKVEDVLHGGLRNCTLKVECQEYRTAKHIPMWQVLTPETACFRFSVVGDGECRVVRGVSWHTAILPVCSVFGKTAVCAKSLSCGATGLHRM